MLATWLSSFAWDGALPVAVALFPWFVDTFFPNNVMLQVAATVFVPIIAALIRANIGAMQIREACNGQLPILRQLLLVLAIVIMFLFEITVAALTFAPNEPLGAWLIPLALYMTYLIVLAFAFRRRRSPAAIDPWAGDA